MRAVLFLAIVLMPLPGHADAIEPGAVARLQGELAFAIRHLEPIAAAAWAHFRVRAREIFRKLDLRWDGDAYPRGEVGVRLASELVSAPVAGAPSPGGEGLFGTDFLLRLRTVLHGIRARFGVLDGRGGSVDPPRDPQPEADFNYGYAEVELRVSPMLGLLGRPIAGLGKDGLAFGFEGRVRLGPEDQTSITLGASTVAGLGFASGIGVSCNALRDFALGLGIAVTKEPNPDGDLAVRLSAEVGWRAVRWVQPTLRLSYQGRTVEHSGLGVGAGLVVDW